MKKIFLLFIFLLSSIAQSEQLMMLVTEAEMLASNNAYPKFVAKSLPDKDAPVIQVLTPKNASSVTSPTPVEIKFLPAEASTVKPETFRVLYGTFQIDITKKILSVTKVTPEGVTVQAANLPSGKHKMTLNIEDNQGRLGSQFIEFEVK